MSEDKKLQISIVHPKIKECGKVTVVEASVSIKVGGRK
jgi:hypothetical protein